MTAKKYSYGTGSILTDVQAALNDKGLITEVKYASGLCLIFTTPLCNKVIKLEWCLDGDTFMFGYYGDAWTGGGNISNSVKVLQSYHNDGGHATGFDIIADTDFFAFIWKNNANTGGMMYLGALDNGDVLIFGIAPNQSSENLIKNLTTGAELYPIGLVTTYGLVDASGNILSMPLMWQTADGKTVMNGANIATTKGIKVSGATYCGDTNTFAGANYYLTWSYLSYKISRIFYTSLLLEFTA